MTDPPSDRSAHQLSFLSFFTKLWETWFADDAVYVRVRRHLSIVNVFFSLFSLLSLSMASLYEMETRQHRQPILISAVSKLAFVLLTDLASRKTKKNTLTYRQQERWGKRKGIGEATRISICLSICYVGWVGRAVKWVDRLKRGSIWTRCPMCGNISTVDQRDLRERETKRKKRMKKRTGIHSLVS